MARLSLVSLVCLALALQLATVGHALAQESTLSSADAAYERGALLEASRLYEAALREGGHERDALIRIHLRLGISSIARRQELGARAHFRAALALDHALVLPEELTASRRAELEALRPTQSLALVLEAPDELPRGEDATVEVRVTGDRELVRTIEVSLGSRTESLPASGGAVSMHLDSEEARLDAVALDEHGGRLARAQRTVRAVELVVPSSEPTTVPTESTPSVGAEPPDGLTRTPETQTEALAPTVESGLACTAGSHRHADTCVPDLADPPPAPRPWFEEPLVWGTVIGVVVVGATAGAVGYLVTEPPGYLLLAPELR